MSSAPQALRASLLSTHVVLRADRRSLHLAARERRAARRGRGGLRERQHLAGPRLARGRRRARRGDVPPRPSADRPREPRQPLRQHRDRGGAAAPRADAERGGARRDRRPGPEGAGDDRARRAGDPGGDDRPARAAGAGAPAVRRARGDGRREDDPARRPGRPAAAQAGRRHLRRDPRRAAGDDRADLHRLRGRRPPRRHRRRRPRPGPDARHRPLPVLQTRGSGAR